jgi:putative transcriptional regulator
MMNRAGKVDNVVALPTKKQAGSIARLARMIRRAREQKGWSQRTLAEQVGLNHEAIRRIELGLTDPRATLLFKLCNALSLDVGETMNKIALGQMSARRAQESV